MNAKDLEGAMVGHRVELTSMLAVAKLVPSSLFISRAFNMPGSTSWAEASSVKQVDSHTYTVNLHNDWCIGSGELLKHTGEIIHSSISRIVPHGGYVTSCIQRVAAAHFGSTLRSQNQPHAMVIHVEFPRRTEIGTATFLVKDVKKGRQTSTIHIALTQNGHEEVIGYVTHANLEAEEGVTFPTGWSLEPAPLQADLSKFDVGNDTHWVEQKDMPFSSFRKASNRVRFFFPRKGQFLRSMSDQWICFRDGTKFTTESLGFVADMFPQVVESYRDEDDPYAVNVNKVQKKKPMGARFWYPTVVLNLDIKKALPAEGVKWLFCRTRSKQIRKGRLDIEVVIMDEAGELVALSHHVTLVLSASRNLAARTRESSQSRI
jgi:acyl-Coa thioesterase superfamily protein/acyl-CoA thioesterase superfamily protein